MDDLEGLRSIFQDTTQHIALGLVIAKGIALGNSKLRVRVSLFPDNREIVAIMTWDDVSSTGGDMTFPELNDLVLVAFADGDPNEAFVIKRLSSKTEKISAFAALGHSVKYAHAGKKLYLGSDTKIALARPGVEPTQPLVLGTVMANCITDIINAFLNASQVGQSIMGPVFLDPAVRTALTLALQTYVNTSSTNILSQIGFTERGT